MVDYETYCRIRDHLVRQQLNVAQTARALGLDARTVARWADVEQFRARKAVPRASKLDAFKGQIVRWLDAHPYSAQQIYQRLAEAGYAGVWRVNLDERRATIWMRIVSRRADHARDLIVAGAELCRRFAFAGFGDADILRRRIAGRASGTDLLAFDGGTAAVARHVHLEDR